MLWYFEITTKYYICILVKGSDSLMCLLLDSVTVLRRNRHRLIDRMKTFDRSNANLVSIKRKLYVDQTQT